MVQGCDSLDHLEPSIHAQRQHSLADCGGRDLRCTDLLHDEAPQRGGHVHGLIQTLPALESGALTYVATLAAEERQLADRGIERDTLRVGKGKLRCARLCVCKRDIAELEVAHGHLRRDLRNCELSLLGHVFLGAMSADLWNQSL